VLFLALVWFWNVDGLGAQLTAIGMGMVMNTYQVGVDSVADFASADCLMLFRMTLSIYRALYGGYFINLLGPTSLAGTLCFIYVKWDIYRTLFVLRTRRSAAW
jgi:lactate dehydrogenase-like 2-hydroxyacid dehydrogenase